MAKSSIYSELLSTNLELLFTNHPPPAELQDLLRKNLFSVPNKRASDELICYLYSVIDGEKYNINQARLKMMLDKKMENSFYTLVHQFSKEISDEYPEENLPKVVKSFFVMPSGDKYVQYLYKLTLIAMKNDLKAAGIDTYPPRRPKDEELRKLETMNDILDQHLKALTKSAEQSHAKNKNRERLLKLQIEKKRKILMELTADLKLKVDKCSLPEHMKSSIFSGDGQKAVKEWSTMLGQRCEKLEKDAEVIKNIKWNISQLNKFITQKKNGTLVKCSSYLGNKDLLNGQFPDDFLNNLLRQAEETLNAQRLEGPADLSPYIPDLEELAKQFRDLLDTVSNCSQLIIQLHDEKEAQIPQLEAALFSDEQLDMINIGEEATCYGHSLINKLCESTPPEMLRNLRLAELRYTPPVKNHEPELQNLSRTDAVNDEDVIDAAESCTPVALDTNVLKPICFERICGGSTWKRALLLSTLKKKQQKKDSSISDFENGMCSSESLTDTPLSQPYQRTSNPVKSLNNLWNEDFEKCKNYCINKKILHVEVPADNESPEKSHQKVNSAVSNPIRTECHLSGLPDPSLGSERINFVFPGLLQPRSRTSGSEAVQPLIIHEQNKTSELTVHHRPSGRHSSEEDSTRVSEVFTSGNLSQEFHNFMQAVTNSNGSLMGASSVFESNSVPSSPGGSMTGIHVLEQTSLDFTHVSSHADASLPHWDDQKDLKRILYVALSPAGISPAEVQSSTPINSSSAPQPERNGHLKEDEKPPQPAAAVNVMSRIPRIKSLGELRLREIRSNLSKEDHF